MKKILAVLFLNVLVAGAFAGEAMKAKTFRVSFANETAAKGDTLATGDSAFCVIPVAGPGGVIPERITIHLPNVLASGDSALVFIQTLPNDAAMVINNTQEEAVIATKLSDNARVGNAKGSNVYRSYQLGTYYYGDGGKELTWSPADSLGTARVQIVFVETAGAPIITGMKALSTSPIYVTKKFKAFAD